MPDLSPIQLKAFAALLQERRRALAAEIRQQISDGSDEHSIALRSQFDDLDPHDDRAVSDWVRDVGIAQVVRDTRELDEVEAALRRIDDDAYGECIDCGLPIPPARLEANPAAVRCITCQERIEAKAGGVRTAL
ncbi:MAG: TraR/DksA family transcriptional regulator [Betaproteobacteria bacterium]